MRSLVGPTRAAIRKSLRNLRHSLCDMGHKIGRTLVGELLHGLGRSLQANHKTRGAETIPTATRSYITPKRQLVIFDRSSPILAGKTSCGCGDGCGCGQAEAGGEIVVEFVADRAFS